MENKTYSVNEIFYSLQGEGRWAGRAAIFIRFSGCNLKCPFCDTDFRYHKEMTAKDILGECLKYAPCDFIVITGGEPTLQVDWDFVEMLHRSGYYVAMETNGTKQYAPNLDWVTVSPKEAYVKNGKVVIGRANEVKIVYDGVEEPSDFGIIAEEYYIQPCDVGNKEKNRRIVQMCVDWVEGHPKWKLSLQQQKILNVR